MLLTNSGYACQMAVTQGLLRSTDAVFYDGFCHSSLVDGMQLSGAAMYRFRNGRQELLKDLLAKHRFGHRGALIVTDGVFSTDGTLAAVEGLIAAARAYDARLFVDDAHGIGTTNAGKGCSVFEGVDLVSGTLSKALGSAGGFVAGPVPVIDYLRLFGNAACNTVHVSVPNAAAALAALKLLQGEPGLVDRLQAKARYFRHELRQRGIETTDSPVPIISLVCGRDSDALRAWRALFDAGLLTHALPFPLVPRGQACVRLRLTLGFDEEHMDTVIRILSSRKELFVLGEASHEAGDLAGGGDGQRL